MNHSPQIPEAQHFTHEAMNTTFGLWLRGVEPSDAPGIARECYEKIDLLESRLSRFIDTSEISRINRLSAGETLYISEECHSCLLLGLEAHALSGGLFDITLGTRIQQLKSGNDPMSVPLTGRWIIHPDVPAVTCVDPGRELDLGGIGKGFALDQLRDLLIDWGVDDALLAAGASSMLAHGPTPWPVELSGSIQSQPINLTGQALSASGTLFQGSHVLHPGGQGAMPDRSPSRVWVTAATAALAEIWSTTLMLMTPEEIPDFIADTPELTSVHIEYDDRLEKIR